ncbi:TPA: polyphosphate polymerase domain-containing protein [Clostridium perfringens]|uniref:polyphosphate polymerase domain-containing protein n=1 Tax=Clostridium perfringens TaxID=1502 RepID=UPI000F531AF9|nr:polyphosphate polymerase domain-containing protein [Clostridium perfringens]EGT0014964.1 polyphosphate polymerase domain-containing protein [Clostridium perfringens]EGT3607034.1 polyphosphate polymerase domain-containing protein [Clostridium perfringens]EJT6341074.1 polyphosphate polymerase domain-containing protein [Clostridium perfringens]ELC8425634.1 polyphosphate polymerase domain-containing protein [Clostridium perfringens]ELQ0172311.1 polyphosphate polymerase domain-containing protein
MLSVSRKEVKFLVSSTDRVYLLNSLSQILVPDKYGDYNGYKTRSIYFDSIDNEDFREKQIKTEKRKRIRVRIYNEEDKFAKFEIKRKHFERELKESITITKEDAIRLINREYSVLLNYKDNPLYEYAFNLMKSKLYRPVSMVEYDRRAFTHEFFNTRVTLDNNLRFTNFNYDLFNKNINFQKGLPGDKSILEVKYDRFLFQQLQEVLSKCNFVGKPPSKFGTSRQLLNTYYY